MSSGGGRSAGKVTPQLGRLFSQGTVTGFSEAQLLEAFVSKRDDAAFEAIVTRHGPMVLKVCRQILKNPADVEDAFQATFIVLVRRASSLSRRELLGNWLYGVAYRVASRSRSLAAGRVSKVASNTDVDELCSPPSDSTSLEFDERSQIHEALSRLPDRYRIPLILCYFEGLTHEEAAERLGWPIGSVKGRLARARDLMKTRLVRQGVGLATGAALATFEKQARATALPEILRNKTVRAALAISGESARSLATSTALSLSVASLAKGVIRTMVVSQIRALVLPALLGVGIVSTGASVVAYQLGQTGEPTEKEAPKQSNAQAEKPASPGQNAQKGATQSNDRRTQAGQQSSSNRRDVQNQANSGGQPEPFGAAMGRARHLAGGGLDETPQGLARRRQLESRQRQDIATLAALIAEKDTNLNTKEVLKKLDEPISMNFSNETPLEDVLKYIQSATSSKTSVGLPIYVDPAGLQEAEKTVQSPVQINLEHIPLKTTLRLLLKQLDLAYCVHDGFLMISSPEGIREELDEARAALGIPEPEGVLPQGAMGGGMMGGQGGGMM